MFPGEACAERRMDYPFTQCLSPLMLRLVNVLKSFLDKLQLSFKNKTKRNNTERSDVESSSWGLWSTTFSQPPAIR